MSTIHLASRPDLVAAARAELADTMLLCWCAIGDPCHADVLRRVANPGPDVNGSRLGGHGSTNRLTIEQA